MPQHQLPASRPSTAGPLLALIVVSLFAALVAFTLATDVSRQPGHPGTGDEDWTSLLDPFRNRNHLVLKPDNDHEPVPSIAPLADQVPLHKIDVRALDKKLVRSAADKMVIANYFAKKFGHEVFTLLGYTDHAVEAAGETRLDPLLLLAIISVESNFDPNVESPVGAQGLMQVMTRIHASKFEPYGGTASAFRPEVNIRIGALIIKQALAMMGSLPGALRFYVGAARPGVSDGGFVDKVLGEYGKLIAMLGGNAQAISVPISEQLALQQRFEPDLAESSVLPSPEGSSLR